MDNHQRYEALLRIQTQLQDWSAYQPPWHYKLHGSKEINECLQLMKQLILYETTMLLMEEQAMLDNSLGLHNIE